MIIEKSCNTTRTYLDGISSNSYGFKAVRVLMGNVYSKELKLVSEIIDGGRTTYNNNTKDTGHYSVLCRYIM